MGEDSREPAGPGIGNPTYLLAAPDGAHLTHIYRKLDINTRARLAALVMEQTLAQ